jgi:hypothetical protein
MARKLKTYQTSLGFFEQAVAAPSMKAALEAWGADSNLFHQGAAKESTDPGVIGATMKKPGVPVGSDGPFGVHAELPKDLGLSERRSLQRYWQRRWRLRAAWPLQLAEVGRSGCQFVAMQPWRCVQKPCSKAEALQLWGRIRMTSAAWMNRVLRYFLLAWRCDPRWIDHLCCTGVARDQAMRQNLALARMPHQSRRNSRTSRTAFARRIGCCLYKVQTRKSVCRSQTRPLLKSN